MRLARSTPASVIGAGRYRLEEQGKGESQEAVYIKRRAQTIPSPGPDA